MLTQKNVSEDSKRVGIWIRVSTEDQVRGESPEHHERRARLYAEAKGWDVIEMYRLDAISGKTVWGYPETKKMLEDIKSGHITGLIFSKLARLARNTKELLEFAEIFRDCDADLISLAESIDTSTPAGRLFYTMIAAMAQWEREEISARVAASVPIRAKMGKSLGGQTSFGYQWKEGKLLPDPIEAPIRKLMYELFLDHKRKKTVARILNERGYRTRNGSLFSDSTITRLLRDPMAKGVRRANYTLSKDSKKAWEFKPESEWVFLEVEAIISEDLWNEVNAILDTQKNKEKRPSRQVTHLFTGFTYCGCGQKMYVPSNTPKYVCYDCRNKIPVVDLEGVFHEQIKNFFFSKGEIAEHLSKANANIHEKEELLLALLKKQKKLTAEIDKLYELYQGGAIDKAGFGGKYHPLAEQGRQLDDEIPQVQAELDVLKISHLSQEEVITGARDLYTRWPELPHEEKRRIVEAVTERIVIHDDEVEINLFYAPSTSAPPIGSPFTPPTPSSSTPPPTSPLNGGGMATRPQGRVAFLPFVRVCLKSLRKKPFDFEPQTLGERIKKRRLELGLSQKKVGEVLDVTSFTVLNWEKGKTEPPIRAMPDIFSFLGYDPFPVPSSIPECMIAKRRAMGWSIKEASRCLGVDEGTWGAWERGETILFREHRALIASLLGLSDQKVDCDMRTRWNRLHQRRLTTNF